MLKNALILLFTFISLRSGAQDYNFSQLSHTSKIQLNPAFTGAEDFLNYSRNFRTQKLNAGQETQLNNWSGDIRLVKFWKNPDEWYTTSYFGIGGSGGVYLDNNREIFRQEAYSIAYHYLFEAGLKFSGAVQYSITEHGRKLDKTWNAGFLVTKPKAEMDCDINRTEFGVGFFGLKNFTEHRERDSLGYLPAPKMQIHASHKFEFKNFYIMPSGLVKVAEKSSWQLGTDIVFAVHHKYHDRVRFGVRYRSDDHFNYTTAIRLYTPFIYAAGVEAYGSYDGRGFNSPKNSAFKNAYEVGFRLTFFYSCGRIIIC